MDINVPGFSVRNRNWLGFIVAIEIILFLCGGQNWLRFCVPADNYLVLVYG